MELEGAICLVTGAASGIGAALTEQLEQAGAGLVAAVDLHKPASPVAPASRLPVAADVSRLDELRAAFTTVLDSAGRLDVVFNNAGILGEPWPLQSPESAMRVAMVNLGATMAGTRLALDAMTSGGVVINTASKTGLFEHPEAAAYAATKAGIIHFTRCCASLAGTHGVRVNAVLPGLTDTPMFASQAAPTPGAMPLDPRAVARMIVAVAADDTIEPGSYRLADREALDAASRDG
jgi:NAD(P)-dependent dehydrogenase (short-subunit alcohol dehydrogenase family)